MSPSPQPGTQQGRGSGPWNAAQHPEKLYSTGQQRQPALGNTPGRWRDQGQPRGTAAALGTQRTRRTQLFLLTAPVHQPRTAQTKACNPAKPAQPQGALRGSLQLRIRPWVQKGCRAAQLSTAPLQSAPSHLRRTPSRAPPAAFLALLMRTSARGSRCCLSRGDCGSSGCAGGDRGWRQLAGEHGEDMSPT